MKGSTADGGEPMHAYATNFVDRTRVVYQQAVVAVGVFLIVGIVLHRLDVSLPFWVSAPSAGGTFTAIFALYDRVLWRRSVLGRRLSRIPDLNGTYDGYVHVESGIRPEEGDADIPCWVRIEQTWSRLSIRFESEFTTSRSAMAALDMRAGHPLLEGLRYEYHVEPKRGTAAETLGSHGGLARLLPQDDTWSVMHGEFFSDRALSLCGAYHIERLDQPVDIGAWLAGVTSRP